MPRLSVEIDLTYVPVHSRGESLKAIDAALKRIAETAASTSPADDVVPSSPNAEGVVTKLLARGDNVQVKVEVTPVHSCCAAPETGSVMKATFWMPSR